MERVGVREFKNRATQLLRAGRPLVIERHGEVVGYYLPVPVRDEAEIQRRRADFERELERLLAQAGLTQDEFEQLVADTDARPRR